MSRGAWNKGIFQLWSDQRRRAGLDTGEAGWDQSQHKHLSHQYFIGLADQPWISNPRHTISQLAFYDPRLVIRCVWILSPLSRVFEASSCPSPIKSPRQHNKRCQGTQAVSPSLNWLNKQDVQRCRAWCVWRGRLQLSLSVYICLHLQDKRTVTGTLNYKLDVWTNDGMTHSDTGWESTGSLFHEQYSRIARSSDKQHTQ